MSEAHADGALALRDVTITLGDMSLIGALSLCVPVGEVATVMGESGAGKSTLLAYLCGTLPAAFQASGSVRVGGREISGLPPERRRVGILFQDDLLFPHMSVGENLAFALSPRVRGRRARRRRVADALGEAGLSGFERRDPATLSGGQRARVAVMRTLLSEPAALLLDEPFSKLDAGTRARFRRFVFDHARQCALPTLMVTHEADDARAAGGPVVRLAGAAHPR